MTIPKPGDELKLRNGWPAKVLAVHPGQDWPIIGEVFNEHIKRWQSTEWSKSGDNVRFPAHDLMLPTPELKRLCGWVNVYRSGQRAWFDSKEMADSPSCAAFRTACVHIVQPYVEGEGL